MSLYLSSSPNSPPRGARYHLYPDCSVMILVDVVEPGDPSLDGKTPCRICLHRQRHEFDGSTHTATSCAPPAGRRRPLK